MRNTLDNFNVIGYIDSSFRIETFRKSYGFLDLVKRADERRKIKEKQEGITKDSTILGGSSGGSSGGY